MARKRALPHSGGGVRSGGPHLKRSSCSPVSASLFCSLCIEIGTGDPPPLSAQQQLSNVNLSATFKHHADRHSLPDLQAGAGGRPASRCPSQHDCSSLLRPAAR